MSEKKDKYNLNPWWTFSAIGFVLLISCMPYWMGGETFSDNQDFVTSLFAGLAFLGVVFTLVLQKSELDETRKTMEIQRFETTFFNLLSYNKDHLMKLFYIKDDQTREIGLEALIETTSILKSKIMKRLDFKENETKREVSFQHLVAIATEFVGEIPLKYKYRFDPYVRSFMSVVDFVLAEDQRLHSKYLKILDSLISQAEFEFICYYALLEEYSALDSFIFNSDRVGNTNFIFTIDWYKKHLRTRNSSF